MVSSVASLYSDADFAKPEVSVAELGAARGGIVDCLDSKMAS